MCVCALPHVFELINNFSRIRAFRSAIQTRVVHFVETTKTHLAFADCLSLFGIFLFVFSRPFPRVSTSISRSLEKTKRITKIKWIYKNKFDAAAQFHTHTQMRKLEYLCLLTYIFAGMCVYHIKYDKNKRRTLSPKQFQLNSHLPPI